MYKHDYKIPTTVGSYVKAFGEQTFVLVENCYSEFHKEKGAHWCGVNTDHVNNWTSAFSNSGNFEVLYEAPAPKMAEPWAFGAIVANDRGERWVKVGTHKWFAEGPATLVWWSDIPQGNGLTVE